MFDKARGRRFELLRFVVAAGEELLEGNADRAANMFREAIDQSDEVEGPHLGAEWRAVFAEVMPDRPEARVAAEEAHAWFSEVGANGYLKVYSHVWDRHLGEQAAEAG